MKFLLLSLGISFFFIFFLLSPVSLSSESLLGNLYIEAHIYIILSIILIVKVLKNDFTVKKSRKEKKSIFSFLSLAFFLPLIRSFFGKYIYYIACSFFYVSVFLLLKVFLGEIHIPKMFLIFNILILSLYFIEHKFKVFQDFLRVNTIIISLYYAIFQLAYLVGASVQFSSEDIINITIIFVLLFLFLYSSGGKKYNPVIASYLVVYIFLEYLVLLQYFVGNINLGASIVSFFISIYLLGKTTFISKILGISKELVRIWGLVFSYMFLYFSGILIFNASPFFLILLPAVVISSLTLYDFHKEFQNYISLFFGSLGFLVFFYGLYSFFIPENLFALYIFMFFLVSSGIFLYVKKIYSFSYIYDRYFFQIFSLFVNISGVLCFFFFWEISILAIALLFLWESIYLFLLYYNFRNSIGAA